VDARALLAAYVEAHNAGVRCGDFARLVALLEPACEMHFTVVRAGPYIGREAIAHAFQVNPPGAELHTAEITGDAASAHALYGWVGAAATFSGSLRVEAGPGGIRRVEVRAFGN